MRLRFAFCAAAINTIALATLLACSPDAGTLPAFGSGGSNAAGGKTATGSGGQTNNANGGASNSGGANSGGNGNRGGSANGGTGSGTGGSTGTAQPATWASVKLVLTGTTPPCGSAPCHGAGGMAPPGHHLTLADDGQLYNTLFSYVSKACGNIPLVTKGNPDQSALMKILKGPCGDTPRMPYGCSPSDDSCVPDDYIAAVGQWIAKGAPQQ